MHSTSKYFVENFCFGVHDKYHFNFCISLLMCDVYVVMMLPL